MIRISVFAMVMALAIFSAFGCSGGGSKTPVNLPEDVHASTDSSVGRMTWGLWQFTADPENEILDVVQLRNGNFHLNALPFLEPPAFVNLSLDSLEFNGNEIYAEIGLRHPFLGLTEFTGFDVCGILITNGSFSGFDDPDIVMAGEGDTYLLNPDAYSRWWNPAEFPVNNGTIFSYTDGLLGAPNSLGAYNSTINAYKFYCDDLTTSEADIDSLNPASRCMFSAGQKNSRMFRISLGPDGLVFNYAVDASWLFPDGDPPWVAPDDFPLEANRPEAWNVVLTELENTLWNDGVSSGGDLSLSIDVWDHQNAEMNTVEVESPGNLTAVSSTTIIGGGDGYQTYQVNLTDGTPAEGSIDLLITVESEEIGYQDMLPGMAVSSWFSASVNVATESPMIYDLDWTDETRIEYSLVNSRDEFEAAVCGRPNGELYIGFIQVYFDNFPQPGHRRNYPRQSLSTNNGQTFSYGSLYGLWPSHGGYFHTYNAKFTTGPDGYLWFTYTDPPGHCLERVPGDSPPIPQNYYSFLGTAVQHAGEMLYTSEGYPMMFGDKQNYGDTTNILRMHRGDFPNYGGTGNWPSFLGTEYINIPDAWLSVVRSTGRTSNGICRLLYWTDPGEIHLLSSDNISGTTWTNNQTIFTATSEGYTGANDPGLWIDTDDVMYVTFRASTATGSDLIYGISTNGVNFGFGPVPNAQTSASDPEDTEVAIVTAFTEDFVFLVYETGGNVYLQWKLKTSFSFSNPITVNTHQNAELPDIYPNGGDGLTIAYQADGDYGNTDIFFRTCDIVEIG